MQKKVFSLHSKTNVPRGLELMLTFNRRSLRRRRVDDETCRLAVRIKLAQHFVVVDGQLLRLFFDKRRKAVWRRAGAFARLKRPVRIQSI